MHVRHGFVLASLAAASLAVALASSTAARVPIVVRASAPPASLEAGATWTVTLRITRGGKPVAGARVTVRASGPGAAGTRRAVAAGRGIYRARLTFTAPGTWTVSASVAGRSRRIARVSVTAPVSPLAGWRASRICGGMGNPQPQYAVAVADGSAWVGCPAQRTVMRVDADTGRVLATIPTLAYPWSIAAAGGSLWFGERSSIVSRLDPARRATSTALRGADIPYLWAAAGSLWVADDGARALLRVDPATATITARIPTGDGPSDVVSDGRTLWFANHREGTIDRVDLATNAVARLGRVNGDAPERLELAFGSLWITGRGTDLQRLDPVTGAVSAVVDVGAGAIDLVATANALWVAAPTDADDRRGLPQLERLLRIDPATNAVVETVRPSRAVMVNGLAWDGRRAWIADVANGRLLALEP